jgi:hypothetical protein
LSDLYVEQAQNNNSSSHACIQLYRWYRRCGRCSCYCRWYLFYRFLFDVDAVAAAIFKWSDNNITLPYFLIYIHVSTINGPQAECFKKPRDLVCTKE